MSLLLDTHLLLWVAWDSPKLSEEAREILDDADSELFFSSASLWEIAIKTSLGRKDFQVDTRAFRQGLLDNSYSELYVTGLHAVNVDSLPLLHKDPFDRILLAQAIHEGLTLLTSDSKLAQYLGPVRKV